MASPSPELWLMRHGLTAWALDGRHTGRTDLPLLPEGETEARALAPLLASVQFNRVLVSPLQRAVRTCELAGLGHRAELCDDLLEWNYGAYEGITTAEIRRSVPGWTVFTHPCPGGESLQEVEERCARLLEHIRASLAEAPEQGGRVALFAHGHLLRCLAGTWLGLGAAGGALLSLGTGTVSVLAVERDLPMLRHWNAPVDACHWGVPPSHAAAVAPGGPATHGG